MANSRDFMNKRSDKNQNTPRTGGSKPRTRSTGPKSGAPKDGGRFQDKKATEGKRAPRQAGKSEGAKPAGERAAKTFRGRPKFSTHYKPKNYKSRSTEDTELIRLNKYIANSGLCSRREADTYIQNGVVTVNGKIITELGYKVQQGDKVKFDGRQIKPEAFRYLLLNKPKNFITTADDPDGRKTVMQLIRGACKERLYPVGRLDRNTTGLLLFTNDGLMTEKLMHPRRNVKKIYHVELDKGLSAEDFQTLKEGVQLEDGFFKPDQLEYTTPVGGDKRHLGIEIHSGKNRIVRRFFEHMNYTVVKLDRVMYAGLTKKNLPRGHWRFLEETEVNFLKMI